MLAIMTAGNVRGKP
jgi:hypothetical protein